MRNDRVRFRNPGDGEPGDSAATPQAFDIGRIAPDKGGDAPRRL